MNSHLVFSLLAAVLNGALATMSLLRGDYWYTLVSIAATVLCIVVIVRAQRSLPAVHWWQLAPPNYLPRERWPSWMAQQQLDDCFNTGTCPDCGQRSLNRKLIPMLCQEPGCGSRFHRDPHTLRWSRA